mgnify:FL=1
MSDEMNPGMQETAPDVAGKASEAQEEVQPQEDVKDYSNMTLAELSQLFEKFSKSEDRMTKSKEAEAIKAAFYKRLSKEKAAAGLEAKEDVISPEEEEVATTETPDENTTETANPFVAIEKGFKAVYLKYKKERAEYNRKLDEEREKNLVLKQAVIADLKALVEKQEDLGTAFPEFKELQARWRAIGQVPVQNFRTLNDTYQFYVEQFYDKVQINRDLRDLDFKKNLEAKEDFCAQAEKLSKEDNIVEAFKELQKLHEQWKEYGPVAKEFREQIWDRFKAATAIINKKYQEFFEKQKAVQAENLAAKEKICAQIEEIAAKEIKSTSEWSDLTKTIEDFQKEWKSIGYASRKENQKVYDRFHAACDKFFDRKRVYYQELKNSLNANTDKKLAIIKEAESLSGSTEWKKTADRLIALQKEWKEIGAVPRKKSDQLWKRFRSACDTFFAERDKHASSFAANLEAKKALIAEINAFDGDSNDMDAKRKFQDRWRAIGFVPMSEKEAVTKAFDEAIKEKFSNTRAVNKSPKDKLMQRYRKLQQDIDTYENNIGFFAKSKNSQQLKEQMQERIDASKKQLSQLEEEIKALNSAE